MGVLRRILAVILGLISLSLGVQFVGGEIYGLYMAEPNLVWDYLNWLTAFGVVVTLVYHYRRKRALDRQHNDDSVSFNYLSTNLMLFAAMFLNLWFFANWFEELSMDDQGARAVVGFIWMGFNASFVVLGGLTAWQLWHGGPEQDERTGAQLTPPGSLLVAPSGVGVERQTVAPVSRNVPASAPGEANAIPGGGGTEPAK
jgi:hypothetical protein